MILSKVSASSFRISVSSLSSSRYRACGCMRVIIIIIKYHVYTCSFWCACVEIYYIIMLVYWADLTTAASMEYLDARV